MYPDRRPYASTMPHSGYCAKPIAPQPPAAPLTMLRSHVGFDDLRHNGREDEDDATKFVASSVRTAAGRTYPSLAATTGSAAALQHILPPTDRSAEEALAAAELQPPIEHDALTYHGCQQAALNAELREKVEAHRTTWAARVADIRCILAGLPAENALQGSHEVESLRKYFEAYRCTEEMFVDESELVDDGSSTLRTPSIELYIMTHLPPVPSDAMRRLLDDMLRSPYLLAPLQNYVTKLSVLDKIGALRWSGEGAADVADMAALAVAKYKGKLPPVSRDGVDGGEEQGEKGMDEEESEDETTLCPSRAAVALHERLHFNPGDYSERELKKSERALMELQQQVKTVKQKKEDAIDANDPITALRSLHAQVDFSNDLLLLYKARMAQVGMHTDDVQEFRSDVVNLIDDARRAAQIVKAYADKALPTVRHDAGVIAAAIEASDKALADAKAAEKAAELQMREQLQAMDGETCGLWREVLALLEKISEKAQERTRYMQQCMSRREQRAKEAARAEAKRKAQDAHRERLRQCEEVLLRCEAISGVYTKYVEACVPKLLKHLASVEEAHEDLVQREAEGYVSVFEQFVYATEEARAKRRTQADRMRLLQRSEQLNQERANDTLDPDAASHTQRLADVARELDEVQLYLKYINEMEQERRAEVDPVLKRVLVRHAQSHAGAEGSQENGEDTAESQRLLENGGGATAVADAAKSDSKKDKTAKRQETPAPAVVAAAKVSSPDSCDDGAAAIADSDNAGAMVLLPPDDVSDPATMAHPFVAARQIGLAHEENYLMKQGQLTERELQELEEKQTGLRHSREELRAMEEKYRNGETIRTLLGLN